MLSLEPSVIELPPNSRMFGNPKTKTEQLVLQVDPAHLASVDAVLTCPPTTAAHLATKLLGSLFSDEQLANSVCTEAEGRQTIPSDALQAIKCKLYVIFHLVTIYTSLVFITGHVAYLFPLPSITELEKRWKTIVVKNLNGKCRDVCKKLTKKSQEEKN